MKDKFTRTAILLLMAVMSLCLTACSDDEYEGPNRNGSVATKEEWYVAPPGFATISDFAELNEAIDNHEKLSDYGKYGVHYAEVDEFLNEDGSFGDSNAGLGRLRFGMKRGQVRMLHIIDDMTAELVHADLFVDTGKKNANGANRYWYFNAGRHFGNMAYYYYFSDVLLYTKKGNTYIFSNGDVLIKKSAGLQGNDGIWERFTPKFE